MKTLAWITTAFCIVYGAFVFVIYQTTEATALEETKNLRKFKAKVESIQRCPGKGLCYLTIVSYQKDGKVQTAKVIGEHGKEGTFVAIWTKPGSPKGYESLSAYIEQSTAFLPLLFLSTPLIIFPLLLSLQGINESAKLRTKGEQSA